MKGAPRRHRTDVLARTLKGARATPMELRSQIMAPELRVWGHLQQGRRNRLGPLCNHLDRLSKVPGIALGTMCPDLEFAHDLTNRCVYGNCI